MCVIILVREICKLALNVALSNSEFWQLKDLHGYLWGILTIK